MEDSTASCEPNAELYGQSSVLSSCWGCVEMTCGPQLVACTEDCPCNAAVVRGLSCTNGGMDAVECFTQAFAGGDAATTSFIGCLAMAGSTCSCPSTGPAEDASSGCVVSGSSSGGGNGDCTSDFAETCGGTTYKAVCSCPQGQCVCFGASSTTVVSIDSCPYCPGLGVGPLPATSMAQVFSECGFPQ
jgi:hypothetical protein